MPATNRILVVSFSPIYRDARVLRQISALEHVGEVTTVGYGDHPAGATHHFQIPDGNASLPQTIPGVLTLGLRQWKRAEMAAPASKRTVELVGDRRYDVVVANDARALPAAFAVANGAPVVADLHEWARGERTHVAAWRILVSPLMDHICREYLPRTSAASTVGAEIAKLYECEYGVRPQVVRNAAPFHDLEPTRVSDDVIRLVHTGAANYGRNIEAMIEATIRAGERYTLDLYLVPAADGGAYLKTLKEAAGGNPRVTFHDPVKPHEIPDTINEYDVGIFWIPPFSTNARLTLPNKIFDFIQGRLAVAVGPSIEMVKVVNDYGIGVVSEDYTVESIIETLASITPDQVRAWKSATNRAAHELSFEREAQTIQSIVRGALEPTA